MYSAIRNLKKGFVGEGSSLGYTERTSKGFVDIFILFLGFRCLWTLLEISGNFFGGSVKYLFFLECRVHTRTSISVIEKETHTFRHTDNYKGDDKKKRYRFRTAV
jgi:hypothetical protein